ncbi:MAG TPA: hypothetical protein VF800_00415 [Telluria sp.]|jgi:hypothetical protein
MNYFPHTLQCAAVALTIAASVLPAAPALAATSYLSSADGGASAKVYWYWAGGTRKTTGFHLTDVRCDGRTPMIKFYLPNGTTATFYNSRGCGNDIWYPNSFYFNAFQVCNRETIWGIPVNYHCGPIVRP